MKTKVIPLGEHRDRLLSKIGVDNWIYNGEPVRDRITHLPPSGVIRRIDCYLFVWKQIPKDVQQAMVESRAAVFGLTEVEARYQLERMPCAIPCADVRLEKVIE